MSEYFKENEFANGFPVNLKQRNFRMAVNVEDYHKPYELKDDPKYVKWIFRMYGMRDGVYFQRVLDYHICTDADYDEFYPT